MTDHSSGRLPPDEFTLMLAPIPIHAPTRTRQATPRQEKEPCTRVVSYGLTSPVW
ncbi:hypothetical protein [Phytoactinopolyspora halotolerans]|uniref:Uncharacterized protein n=1 Tax=Phytoactinopolyspora halotolerans TaxID=1981512 RepID=A0A6L9S7G0_9ACTN|nr:hypothetical protein [Phytoactinopolyspora halotolerans]NEE00917.1 hypothetical protein [Phytoactinopolyspora halotolerans]